MGKLPTLATAAHFIVYRQFCPPRTIAAPDVYYMLQTILSSNRIITISVNSTDPK